MKFFEHELPIDPSSINRWEKRIGEAGTEKLLVEFAFDNTTTVNPGMMIACIGARWMGGAGIFMRGKRLVIQIITQKSLKLDYFV
jgi:hypothetical protein